MFEKEKSIMDGKGEWEEDIIDWITVKGSRIPIRKGETKEEAIERFNQEKKQETFQSLVNVLYQIKNIRYKELRDYIKNLNPIKLTIKDDEIVAQFDKYTAKKNIYDQGHSDKEGYRYKISNISEMPKIVGTSKYNYSKSEQGKQMPQHKGVKQWHYFGNEIETEKGKFKVLVNIRDKGNEQFVYEVAFRKKKTDDI